MLILQKESLFPNLSKWNCSRSSYLATVKMMNSLERHCSQWIQWKLSYVQSSFTKCLYARQTSERERNYLPSGGEYILVKEIDNRSLAINNIVSYRTNGHLKMNSATISVRRLSDVTEKPAQWVSLVPHFFCSDHQSWLSLSRVIRDQMLSELALLCFMLSSFYECAAPAFTMWSSDGSGL